MATKFELPKVEDLKLTMISHDATCQYLQKAKSVQLYPTQYNRDMKNYHVKIGPYVDYYRKQIDYYNQTTYEIITNELALILHRFPKQEKQKRGIITSLITGFTVHRIHNQTIGKLFAGKIEDWYHWYLSEKGVGHYAINSLLFLTTARKK